jgi:acetyl esterase/lipase
MRRASVRLIAVLVLLGVGPVALAQKKPKASAVPKLPEGVKVLRDLAYVTGGHERNKLDLYLPEKSDHPLPLIVWIHGGGWQAGSKDRCPGVRLIAKGYAVASINYRFSQDAIFPAQIEDCKAAIRWLRANAQKYQLDPEHIGVWGGSAGGHLVALLGTTAAVKALEGSGGNPEQSSRVQAVVDWYGPANFLTIESLSTRSNLIGGDLQENKEKSAQASPVTYVSRDAAPFLIMHGDKDERVPLSQSQELAESLKKAGVEVTLVVVPGAVHGSQFNEPENMQRIEDFFNKHLRKPN